MTSTGDPRLKSLLDAVEKFIDVHNNWVNDSNAEYPTIAYWDGLDELIEGFNAADIPPVAKQLAAAVYELALEKQVHEASDNIEPHNAFWVRRERLENIWQTLRHGVKAKYRESVKELDRQGVPHEQIARIWGLRHRDGSGNAALVARELEYPGSVIGPDYIHPDDWEADQIAQAAIDRYRNDSGRVTVTASPEQPGGTPRCPETSEELWLQKVPMPQAAKMLGVTQEQLAMEWKEFEQARQSRKEAREAAEAQATTVTPPSPPPVLSDAVLPPTLEHLAEGEDPFEPFADWTDEDVKTHARSLGLKFPAGRWSRQRTLEQILEAEAQAEAEAKQEIVVPQTVEVTNP